MVAYWMIKENGGLKRTRNGVGTKNVKMCWLQSPMDLVTMDIDTRGNEEGRIRYFYKNLNQGEC